MRARSVMARQTGCGNIEIIPADGGNGGNGGNGGGDGDITAAFGTIVNGLTVTGDASDSTAVRGITGYSWDWGDGSVTTGVQSTHTYDSPGTYTITLTVSDAAGNSDSTAQGVTVEQEGGGPPTQGGEIPPIALLAGGAAVLIGAEKVRSGEIDLGL